MSVGLLLITHPGIGRALLETAVHALGECPLNTHCLEIDSDADLQHLLQKAGSEASRLDEGEGVLILTDVHGATPSNLAHQLREHRDIAIVSGVNLPMLLRIFNYAGDSLQQLASKAVEGGRRDIRCWEPEKEQRPC